MPNIFRKAALAEKKNGDSSDSKPVQIFRLPTKALLGASVTSALVGALWAATAKIPIDFPGRAVVINVDTQQDVVSGGTGRIVLVTKDMLLPYNEELETAWDITNNPRMQLSSQEIAKLAATLLELTTFTNYERFLDSLTTQQALRKISLREVPTSIGIPMAIVFSDSARSDLVKSLKKNFETLADARARILRAKSMIDSYQTMLSSQTEIVQSYGKLRKKNYVSKPDYLQQRSLATQYKSQIAQSKADLDQANIDEEISLKSLMIALQSYISSSFVLSEADGYIANLKVGQGSIVQAGNEVITIERDSYKDELPLTIAGLIGTTAINFVQPGDRVVATPLGVNKAEYGGMLGVVKTVVPFGEDTSSLSSILGTSTLVSQTSTGMSDTPNLVLITMDRDKSGNFYKWTSKNIPARRTRLGDVLNISLTTDSKTPLQLVIPFVRTAIGIDGPTTFVNVGGQK